MKEKLKIKLKRGDTVLIISGKDRGKTGKIEKVLPKTNQILVTGVNIIKKHTRPTKKNPHGGIIQINKPISVANVMLICPQCNKPTRIGFKMLDGGKKLRVCKKCKESVEQ
jgi:large subunit ribosomal protein L24